MSDDLVFQYSETYHICSCRLRKINKEWCNQKNTRKVAWLMNTLEALFELLRLFVKKRSNRTNPEDMDTLLRKASNNNINREFVLDISDRRGVKIHTYIYRRQLYKVVY